MTTFDVLPATPTRANADILSIARSSLLGQASSTADHAWLAALACELAQRLLPADDCWFQEPGGLARVAARACSRRSAWTLRLGDPDGVVAGHDLGTLAFARVLVAGEEAALVAWRENGWDSPSLFQLADIASLLGEAMTASAPAQLTAGQKARAEYDALRRELMSTIDHELRTPLTAVHGALELLADTDDPALRQRLARAADQGVARLLHLADAVTDRGAAAPVFDDVVATDVAATVRHCTDAWARTSPRRQVLGTGVTSPVRAFVDPVDLREVLDRVVSNALKFSDGPVSVNTAIDTEGRQPWAVLTVRDTGMGVPEHEHHRLGSRFFKASNARTREVQGPGLGLATAMDLVRAWGGEIGFDSVAGQGMTVTIRLPMDSRAGGQAQVGS